MAHELTEAIAGMRAEEAVALARSMLDTGTDPLDIIAAGTEAMARIGQRFSDRRGVPP